MMRINRSMTSILVIFLISPRYRGEENMENKKNHIFYELVLLFAFSCIGLFSLLFYLYATKSESTIIKEKETNTHQADAPISRQHETMHLGFGCNGCGSDLSAYQRHYCAQCGCIFCRKCGKCKHFPMTSCGVPGKCLCNKCIQSNKLLKQNEDRKELPVHPLTPKMDELLKAKGKLHKRARSLVNLGEFISKKKSHRRNLSFVDEL